MWAIAVAALVALTEVQVSPDAAPTTDDPLTTGVPGRPRYSRANAGPGGPMLLSFGVAGGLVLGFLVGLGADLHASGQLGGYTLLGTIGGATVLALATSAYVNTIWINRPGAVIALFSLIAGITTGAGIWIEGGHGPLLGSAIAASTTLALFFTTLALIREAEITSAQATLVGMSALYGLLAGSAAVGFFLAEQIRVPVFWAVYGPVVGMAVGGLLAAQLRPSIKQVLVTTLVPMGLTLTFLALASSSSSGESWYWATALLGLASTTATTGFLLQLSQGTGQASAPMVSLIPGRGAGAGPIPVVGWAARF